MIEKVECEQCLFSSKTMGTMQNKHGIMTAMPLAASNTGIGRRAKRETTLVSYHDLDGTLTCDINDTSALF